MMREDTEALFWRWNTIYRPEWDATPEAYVAANLVGWGRSRRLARGDDPARRFRAYLGVHHDDPARWGQPGAARARFFCSLILGGRTLSLRTFATLAEARREAEAFHIRLQMPPT